MTKKTLNQNAKFVQKFLNDIEPDFVFSKKTLDRFNVKKKKINQIKDNPGKHERLIALKEKIISIEDCNLKKGAKNLVLGDGNINSPIMFIGESPGEKEDNLGFSYQGDVGTLLNKMLWAIKIKREKIYTAYSINFKIPNDKKPSNYMIKRYSVFLKEHISIIDPKIIVLMGSTAMESLMGFNEKISNERGKWKEVIFNKTTFPMIITYSPSYLLRFPEYKKYSWDDLKKIKQKIHELNIKI